MKSVLFFSLPPCTDPYSPAPFLVNTQSTRIWAIYGAIRYGWFAEAKIKHMMFWHIYWLIFIWSTVLDLGFCLRWNVDMQPICLAEWRRTLLVPNVYDVNVESGELVLLRNVPLIFVMSLSDRFLIKRVPFHAVWNLLNTSHFCQYTFSYPISQWL